MSNEYYHNSEKWDKQEAREIKTLHCKVQQNFCPVLTQQ